MEFNNSSRITVGVGNLFFTKKHEKTEIPTSQNPKVSPLDSGSQAISAYGTASIAINKKNAQTNCEKFLTKFNLLGNKVVKKNLQNILNSDFAKVNFAEITQIIDQNQSSKEEKQIKIDF